MFAIKNLPHLHIRQWTLEQIKPILERYLLTTAAGVVVLAALCAGVQAIASRVKPAQGVIKVTVGPGDSLWSYADKYGNPDVYILKRVHKIAQMNKLNTSKPLEVGTELLIPVSKSTMTARAISAKDPRRHQ